MHQPQRGSTCPPKKKCQLNDRNLEKKKGITRHLITNSIGSKFKYSAADLFGRSAPHETVRKKRKENQSCWRLDFKWINHDACNEWINQMMTDILFVRFFIFFRPLLTFLPKRKIAPPGGGQPAAPAQEERAKITWVSQLTGVYLFLFIA